MRPAILDLDEALSGQIRLCKRIAAAGGKTVPARDLGPALRLWSRPWALAALKSRIREVLPASDGPAMVFAGSGDFHHVSALLIARAIEACGPPVTVVHFDNHPDWVKFDNGLHCGSWVGCAARMPGINKLITVGVSSKDIDRPAGKGADLSLVEDGRVELYPYRAPHGIGEIRLGTRRWPTIEAVGEEAFSAFLPSRIGTGPIYITIDKDVLRAGDAITNWDQGHVSLDFLASMIRRLAGDRRIIGVDVVGDWSPAVYGGGLINSLLKRGEALLDQPWANPGEAAARSTNGRANWALLDLFGEVAA